MTGPVQPARRVATWQFVIANRDLETVGFLTPHPDVMRYTRRDCDYCDMTMQITNRDDLSALESAVYTRVLRAWRNGINVFNGEFTEVRETAESWELVAKDPFHNLNWRQVREEVTFTEEDAGDIAWSLITEQEGYETTHLQQGIFIPSVDRTRKFYPGDRVAQAVKSLSLQEIENGFGFIIDAVEGVPGVWAEMSVHYPSGNLNPGARFEFGNGTLENCDDYLRESLPLVNRTNVVGRDPHMVISAESSTSLALHGLWEGDRGQIMTDDSAELAQRAAGAITDEPQYSITMLAGPEAPQWYTDFDVMNTVPVLIRRLGRTLTGNMRVKEVTVLIDSDSGAEELESVTVEDHQHIGFVT